MQLDLGPIPGLFEEEKIEEEQGGSFSVWAMMTSLAREPAYIFFCITRARCTSPWDIINGARFQGTGVKATPSH